LAVTRLSFFDRQGDNEMTKKLDLTLIFVFIWLLLHRFVLEWYKRFLGVP
jgi:hypothetical protein